MKLSNKIEVVVNRNNEVWASYNGNWDRFFNEEAYQLMDAKRIVRSRNYTQEQKNDFLEFVERQILATHVFPNNDVQVQDEKFDANEIVRCNCEVAIQNLMNFFSEFEFEPNFRFCNTFARECTNAKQAKSYIRNYFALTNNPSTESICEKMKSAEFADIINNFKSINPTKQINNRFKLYYGSAGTGKTTMAMEEADNNVMVCHSAMLPSDLMEDFKFDDGKATFIPSALQNAIVEGKQIVLDEINLLPFESLRFLQSILDGKTQFEYKGKTIEIKEGFKIIGTMNLTVNGNVFCLPEPLVDRAEELREFKLTANNLVDAIM